MVCFKDQVVVITGAGNGIGWVYAQYFAQKGAKLLLNDLAQKDGQFLADVRAQELKSKFGVAVVANKDSVEFGEKIIDQCIKTYGRIDVLINNAGILRDKSFTKMQPQDWDLVLKVHMTGSFRCSLAAWKYFKQQKYGRIINTSSGSGLYGNFGQANYSSAKSGLLGLTKTLAKEGAKYNIKVNAIAPIAATAMTKTIMSEDILEAVKPQFVTPLVAVLASKECPESGQVYELGGTWIAKLRLQRSKGVSFGEKFTPEDILQKWQQVTDFSSDSTYPTDLSESIELMYDHYQKQKNQNQQKEEMTEQLPGKWKSEKIYTLMRAYVEKGLATKAVKKCNASYQVTLLEKKGGAVALEFYIVLKKDEQKVGLGKLEGADATFVMTDGDFDKMCRGKLNPQMAYIRRKMKIKGNFRKASAFTPDLFPKPTEENIKKYTEMLVKL